MQNYFDTFSFQSNLPVNALSFFFLTSILFIYPFIYFRLEFFFKVSHFYYLDELALFLANTTVTRICVAFAKQELLNEHCC